MQLKRKIESSKYDKALQGLLRAVQGYKSEFESPGPSAVTKRYFRQQIFEHFDQLQKSAERKQHE